MSFETPPPHPSGERPPQIPSERMPTHLAVIMDGNGRWAAQRGLPRHEGHRVGINDAMRDVVFGAAEIGLSHLSLFLFSTENWKRGYQEVTYLFDTLRDQLRSLVVTYAVLGVRLRRAGRTDGLLEELIEELLHAESSTRHNPGLTLTFCFNYGGRAELTQAAVRLMRAGKAGALHPDHVGESDLADHLLLPDPPDVDLLWRTGGERRISNFLLWQSTHAELHFTDAYRPDIDRRDLWQAINEYSHRQRRHGAAPVSPPVSPGETSH
ncbi:polyprenyl diphosphate synthase [Streptomyces macrosporus]|uniref:polyprenyl diphosphate synthase n=1 Tax=Streptomyces macrosporus TaxID=44032 RepID=UPI0031D64FDF